MMQSYITTLTDYIHPKQMIQYQGYTSDLKYYHTRDLSSLK